MDKNIEHPKVFISYAWGNDTYQQKVLEFAARLKSDGVSVVIDKWNLDPGYDTYAFMEKCVKDVDINFVLILLDRNYAEKANDRAGGVGVETQIISAKIYNDVEQSKFIPIIFERGDDGQIFKPVYLNSRYHIDLTSENAEHEYIKLVRQLYGRKIYPEPPLGSKPAWVDSANDILPNTIIPEINLLKTPNYIQSPKSTILNAFEKFFNQIRINIKALDDLPKSINIEAVDIILDYKNSFIPIRDTYLTLLDVVAGFDKSEDILADCLLKIKNELIYLHQNEEITYEILSSFLNEIFIYTISKLWKIEEYGKINNLITRTYFIYIGQIEEKTFSEIFYSTAFRIIDWVKNKKDFPDDKRLYHSGEAELWINNINTKYTKEDFCFADLLLHNLSVLLGTTYWAWFPKTYVYFSDVHNPQFRLFCSQLKSKYQLQKYKSLFGTTVDNIKPLFDKMQKLKDSPSERYRYERAYNRAEIILDYIKKEEIGTLN